MPEVGLEPTRPFGQRILSPFAERFDVVVLVGVGAGQRVFTVHTLPPLTTVAYTLVGPLVGP